MDSHTDDGIIFPGEYSSPDLTRLESSIPRTPSGNAFKLIIDRTDTHIHCRLYANHALAGKLCFRVEEFDDFKNLILSIGEIKDESRFKREDYAYRKLHKSRGPLGRIFHGESDPTER